MVLTGLTIVKLSYVHMSSTINCNLASNLGGDRVTMIANKQNLKFWWKQNQTKLNLNTEIKKILFT